MSWTFRACQSLVKRGSRRRRSIHQCHPQRQQRQGRQASWHYHQSSRRTYMDVHTRPSHSGMFKRGNGSGGSSSSSSSSSSSPKTPFVDSPPTPPTPPPLEQQQQVASSSLTALYALLLTRSALAAGIIYAFTEYMCDITLCEGPSMTPTLRPAGEIVLIDKWTVRRYGVDRGCRGVERMRDAMQRQQAWEEKQQEQQQNNGRAGEPVWHEPRISVSDVQAPTWRDWCTLLSTPLSVGDVVVVDHPNRKGTVCKRVAGLPGDTVLRPRLGLLVIPDGHVWLEGDNPINSADSRTYGAVPLALVQGRVLCRVWPLRGHALLQRGAPPRQEVTGFTVLPAGYEGQHIIKHRETKVDDQ